MWRCGRGTSRLCQISSNCPSPNTTRHNSTSSLDSKKRNQNCSEFPRQNTSPTCRVSPVRIRWASSWKLDITGESLLVRQQVIEFVFTRSLTVHGSSILQNSPVTRCGMLNDRSQRFPGQPAFRNRKAGPTSPLRLSRSRRRC
jgi:hypothetical protein